MPDADAHDDLEPIPLPGQRPAPVAGAETKAATAVVRDRFLVALAVVAAVAIVLLAVQLRSITRDTEREAECSEALVAIVASSGPGSAENRDALRARLQACLGPGATLPGFD